MTNLATWRLWFPAESPNLILADLRRYFLFVISILVGTSLVNLTGSKEI